MEQEDEEFERLLGEIPQATASAPQSEGFDSAASMAATAAAIKDEGPSASVSPLLNLEVFGDLLQVFQAMNELEPSAQKHDSPVVVRDSTNSIMHASNNAEQSEEHEPLPKTEDEEEEEQPLSSLGFAESKTISDHQFADSSASPAFRDLKLDATVFKPAANGFNENGIDIVTNNSSPASYVMHGNPIKLYNQRMVMVGMPLSPGSPAGKVSSVSTVADGSSCLPTRSDALSHLQRDALFCLPTYLPANANCFPVVEHSAASDARGFSNVHPQNHLACSNGSYITDPRYMNGTAAIVTADTARAFPNLNAKVPNHGTASLHSNGSVEYTNSRGFNVYHNVGVSTVDLVSGSHPYGPETANQLQALPAPIQDLHLHSEQAVAATHFGLPSYDTDTGLHQDSLMSSYLQAQQVRKMHLAWQRKEEEKFRMQQILVHHSQALGCHSGPTGHNYTVPPLYTGGESLYRPFQAGTPMATRDWRLQYCHSSTERGVCHDLTPQCENHCTFFSEGFCSRGENCPVKHSQGKGTMRNRDFSLNVNEGLHSTTFLGHEENQPAFPVKILSRKSSRAVSAALTGPAGSKRDLTMNGHINGHAHAKGQPVGHPFGLRQEPQLRGAAINALNLDLFRPLEGLQMQLKYSSLAEVEGRIYSVAKDQHGCRFLQKKFDEGKPEDVHKIFKEIIDHVVELMTDPFGNYLIQKLLEVCTEDQRLEILNTVTSKGELITVSLNMHGTRAVQKLIETLKSNQQVSMVIESLRSGVVTLIKDLNGNHVIQRCLQHLSNDDSQFIFEAAASHCVEIATHRHGCCVLQRCIDFSKGMPRQRLISEVAANSLLLAQDPFGNYVVQYILELGIPWAFEEVIDRLGGNYAHLSMQKFSSNVVEKCLKLAGEDQRSRLVHELMDSSHLAQLLQDPYANYVIQSALTVSKGALHTSLVEAIRPHMASLRSSPYGKRILSRRNLKKC